MSVVTVQTESSVSVEQFVDAMICHVPDFQLKQHAETILDSIGESVVKDGSVDGVIEHISLNLTYQDELKIIGHLCKAHGFVLAHNEQRSVDAFIDSVINNAQPE